MAARGNATSFPLPWQDLMGQLQDSERLVALGQNTPLPRTGAQLSEVVSILLQTAGGDDAAKEATHFIHQARVRRNVVVELIAAMRARGHQAYKHVNMEHVKERAKQLPEDGVPPEIIRLLPQNNQDDKMHPQKNATPQPRNRTEAETIHNMNVLKPNGVVNEKSSHDQVVVNAQMTAALLTVQQQLENDKSPSDSLQTECIAVKTGNQMIDQFVPICFGIAFAFIFTYNAGMPDMPAWAKRSRHRRATDAPRIEADAWVQAMSRRVEASVSRDWIFGFVTWNY